MGSLPNGQIVFFRLHLPTTGDFAILKGLSSFLCKFFRKNFMGRGTSPFVELVALKLHLIKVPT